MPIEPHGGTLINRIVDGETKNKLEQKARGLEQITINSREISDLEMIATGGLSPLEGFMSKQDYVSVVDLMRLKNGLPWTIPITLNAARKDAERLKEGSDVALINEQETLLGILTEAAGPSNNEPAESILTTLEPLVGGARLQIGFFHTHRGRPA